MAKAVCVLGAGNEVSNVTGTITFTQEKVCVDTVVTGEVRGITHGSDHGFHIHEFGDTTNGWISTGGDFNPTGNTHGGPYDTNRHAGDLGNIHINDQGIAEINLTVSHIPLIGDNSIIGRCVVVHEMKDDLGKGGNEESKRTGNVGPGLAWGVIGVAE